MNNPELLKQISFEVYDCQTSKDKLEPMMEKLTLLYATDFWVDVWEEFLKSEDGKQFGRFDATGAIYPQTAALMELNNIDTKNENWSKQAWNIAGMGKLLDINGQPVNQFWTLETARATLEDFIKPKEMNGYEGEILLYQSADEIMGFCAYTAGSIEDSATLFQKRFSYDTLVINGTLVDISTKELIEMLYPKEKVGLCLDMGIPSTYRGQGLGSKLFDERLKRLSNKGVDVIGSRTTYDSKAQSIGNYEKVGMKPIAFDPKFPQEALFTVRVEDLKLRNSQSI